MSYPSRDMDYAQFKKAFEEKKIGFMRSGSFIFEVVD
ncbi:hypothetical protein PEDI_56690 [Persicobacter diffluens]|uniref:Uncharacterized protein n=1 Tax=Persicobacter diffluens TaxID=981 RepID=A0AAN4W687_9BACT|nr:hypothetical protein PEDI_56690 [Persicobacter diffluens]